MSDNLKKIYLPILALLSVFIFYYLPFHHSEMKLHLVIHTVIEFLCVALSFMIFIIFWGVRARHLNIRDTLLMVSFLAVGLFDTLHALSFKGMPDFISANGVEKAIYFWLAARSLQVLGLLAFTFFPNKPISLRTSNLLLLSTCGLVFFCAYIVIEFQLQLPRMFIEGSGLTSLKLGMEYTLMILEFIAGVFLLKRKDELNHSRNKTLANAAFIMVTVGLCFTLYASQNDVMNFWGHVLKALSYVYIYHAFVRFELLTPYREIAAIQSELNLKIENMKVLENELERSRKIASLGSEVRNIAHDLNNVLMIISNAASSIQKIENLKDDDRVTKRVVQIKQAVKKSQDFMRSLMNFSKDVDAPKEVIDLKKVFVDFSQLLSPIILRNVRLSFNVEPDVQLCIARSDLEQVIFNLVLNARDAIGDKFGEINVDVRNAQIEEEMKFLHYEIPRGEYITLSVKDNGQGIEQQYLNRIFDPFFTTKKESMGTGIGLATVIGIMQKNNGYVSVQSVVNKGSTFTLYFLRTRDDEKMDFDHHVA